MLSKAATQARGTPSASGLNGTAVGIDRTFVVMGAIMTQGQNPVGLITGEQQHRAATPRLGQVSPPDLAPPHADGCSAQRSRAAGSAQPNSSSVCGCASYPRTNRSTSSRRCASSTARCTASLTAALRLRPARRRSNASTSEAGKLMVSRVRVSRDTYRCTRIIKTCIAIIILSTRRHEEEQEHFAEFTAELGSEV